MWDAAAANEKFDAACHEVLVKKYSRVLCRICGFPNCACRGCAERDKIKQLRARLQPQEGQAAAAAKTTAKSPHECWKHGLEGKPGKTDPIEKKLECKQQREDAWAELGCTLALKWEAQCGEYTFP